MSGRLAGKRAIVTGAASGIGSATVSRFVEEGARVAMIDRDAPRLQELAGQFDDVVLPIVADVTDEPALATAVSQTVEAYGGLDVAVANAGVQLFGEDAAADELELDVWRRTLDINLTGAFLVCKHALRALLTVKAGAIICTASPTGLRGVAPGFDAYSSSKAGIVGLVRVLAADYGARGVRVNGIVPGFTDTPLVREIMNDPGQRDPLLDRIPLRRPGTAEEVAAGMVFLASDEASYVTGALLPVDGGITAI
jgi:NAD(P)-dependent dehydrogenase (short-subunit alcohol dehydrogenase family)